MIMSIIIIIIVVVKHNGRRTKACFSGKECWCCCRQAGRRAGRPRYLFTLSHPPLAPLSTTHEQMVHSRRRVIESRRRKCNCSSNYVIAATEQWESLRPQLFIGPGEGVSSSEGLKTWTRRLRACLSPSCEVVKKKQKNSQVTRTTARVTQRTSAR